MMFLITQLFIAVTLALITNEFSEQICNEFNQINDEIDKLNWYLFPQRVQRILPVIMLNLQKRIYFECFGGISCNREFFKKVGINEWNRVYEC